MDKSERLKEIKALIFDKPTDAAIDILAKIIVDLEFRLQEVRKA